MTDAIEESTVTYEELAAIERDFDDVETEIIKQQIALSDPLYTRRAALISQIPHFWPLVLEKAPMDIDQYIQPSDSLLLLSSLTNLSVSHFEPSVDPRSVLIRFEFSPNDDFEDTVLEKKFWWRYGPGGEAGLVSEPVGIRWKEGKDLTGGLLGLVVEAWEAENKSTKEQNGEKKNGKSTKKAVTSPAHTKLKTLIDSTGMGGLSFFAWFGFIGRRISAAESAAANKAERARREAVKAGEEVPDLEENEDEDEGEDESLEIFPDGDDLAVAISEDLWPGAIKYFTQAQEHDTSSQADMEESDEEPFDDTAEIKWSEDEDEEERPAKKQKSKK